MIIPMIKKDLEIKIDENTNAIEVEEEDEIDKQDTRKAVLVLNCERLMISLSKACSNPK